MRLVKEIEDLEHRGDEFTHQIFRELWLTLHHAARPRGHRQRWRARSTTSSTTSTAPRPASSSTRSRSSTSRSATSRRSSRRAVARAAERDPAPEGPAAGRPDPGVVRADQRLREPGGRDLPAGAGRLFQEETDAIQLIKKTRDSWPMLEVGDRPLRGRGGADRERPRQVRLSMLAFVIVLIGDRARLRLHQRLPRRRQLDRHDRLDAGAHSRARRCSGPRSSTSSRRSASVCTSPRPWARDWSTSMPSRREVILAALIGAIVWDLITWWLGLPTSSSHALIGGYAGAAAVARAASARSSGAGWSRTGRVHRDRAADRHRSSASS